MFNLKLIGMKKYEIRRKDNGEIVATFPTEMKAIGWFHNHSSLSFNAALTYSDWDLFEVAEDGTEKKYMPYTYYL